jgi:diazepam-binding inhibitor (GABA receptor modulating acyl-CoA-binding protein)
MAPAQSEAFQKAVVDSKKLTSKPSNEDLLEIYGASQTLCPGTEQKH